MKGDIRESWDEHWAGRSKPASTFGRFSSFVRERTLSRAVLFYADRYLPRTRVLVEMVCGSAEAYSRIGGVGRRLDAGLAAGHHANVHSRYPFLVRVEQPDLHHQVPAVGIRYPHAVRLFFE